MSFADQVWYCNAGNQSTTGYYAVAQFAASTAYTAGQLVRQLTAPAVGNERVFVVIVAGTSSTEPSWTVTRGSKNTSGTVTFQECTGAASLNGDLTNTPTWSGFKAISSAVTLGAIIQRNNGASYWICSTAGSTGASEPAWSNNTAGTTQTDSTVTWTCLGVVGNFTGGQAPHARLASACASTWFAAGNTIYVGDNHAESQSTAITINPTLAASMSKILCHNHASAYPPVSTDLRTTATVSTTGSSAITFAPTGGPVYMYGLVFQAGVGTGSPALNLNSNNIWAYFDSCILRIASTFAGANNIVVGVTTSPSVYVFNNTQVQFGNAQNLITITNTTLLWQNTVPVLASGSAVPNTFFKSSTSGGESCSFVLEALDLSQLTGNFFDPGAVLTTGSITVKDCKLNASMSFIAPVVSGQTLQVVRSDSGAAAYKSARYQYEGAETTETSITRVGGASDPAGQAQSRKIVTTANSQWLRPFKAEPYAIWNPTTGANVTVTIYGTINAGALPNNDDIWLEVEYLGSATSPLGTIVNTTKANLLAANAAVASDSSSWNGFTNAMLDGFSNAVTVSNNFLTETLNASLGANYAWALSASAQTIGKYYFEVTAVAFHGTGNGCGIALPTVTSGNLGSGQNVTSVSTGGVVASNNTNVGGANLGAATAGDVYCIAVDLTARLGWLRRNGGNWNNSGTANPATGTGGLTLQAASAFAPIVFFGGGSQVVGDAFTANFGATAYAQTPPSGFGNWPVATGAWSPFKLTTTLSAPQPGLAGYLHARVRAGKASTTWYIDPQISLS